MSEFVLARDPDILTAKSSLSESNVLENSTPKSFEIVRKWGVEEEGVLWGVKAEGVLSERDQNSVVRNFVKLDRIAAARLSQID